MTDSDGLGPAPGSQAYEHGQGFIRRLNDYYYQSNPGDHLAHRVELLLTLADNAESLIAGDFTKSVLEGLEPWGVSDTEPAIDKATRLRAVAVESLMVGYQATEVYLRQFFAHFDAQEDASPWYAIAAQHAPAARKFANRVEWLKGLGDDPMHNLIGWMFIGDVEKAKRDVGEQAVFDFLVSTTSWTRYFTKHFFEFRNAYNAAKHGLSSVPSQSQISFAAEESGTTPLVAHVLIAGPTLETLEYKRGKKSDGGGLDWQRVTQVFDPVVHARIAAVAADLVGHLWTIGRMRHLGVEGNVNLQPRPDVRVVLRPRDGHRPGRFTQPIATSPLPEEQKRQVLDRIQEKGEDGPHRIDREF